ncbi:PadR family transcriptional regulator [Fulvivirgaceae bacterium BMA10]|uniref:PadR family transcriptional regulator n=1 Tax=Splendidivirga corallicola TaxID=3051826 RepID=A0ABT8KNQ6_9BACT|nr:PadR family transcriptional regulator [Fulvivirgaceae bacterium BMA10]
MQFESISTQEELILLAIAVLYPGAYAYSIQKEIKSEFGTSLALGTIHTILYRLENKELLKSEMGGSDSKRGGRSKRLYTLSNKGFELIREIQIARQAMWTRISTMKNAYN